MKKLISLSLAIVMFLMTAVALSEESSNSQAEIEQSVYAMTMSEEEEIYKEYFESAFVIVQYTRNVSVNISNFLYLRSQYSSLKSIDYSFLLDVKSPLELNSSQMWAMYKYKDCVENSSSYKSYLDSTMSAAMSISRTLPAYLEVFKMLEKPTVPQKYAYVDSCIDSAIAEAKRFYDAAVRYLQGSTSSMPEYDSTKFDYLEIVNDLL